MAIYEGDQQQLAAIVANGAIASANAAAVDALPANGASDYEFAGSFTFVWRGQTLSFRTAIPYLLTPDLLAALNTAGINPVAV